MLTSRDKYAQQFLAKNEDTTIKEAYEIAISAQLMEAGIKVAAVGAGLVLGGAVNALYLGVKRAKKNAEEEK